MAKKSKNAPAAKMKKLSKAESVRLQAIANELLASHDAWLRVALHQGVGPLQEAPIMTELRSILTETRNG